MDNGATSLLQADQAIVKTLEQLNRLKEQAAAHEDASQSLAQTRDGLVRLISATSELAERTHKAMETLSSVGAPQVVAGMQQVTQKTDALTATIKEALAKSGAAEAMAKVASEKSDLAMGAGLNAKQSAERAESAATAAGASADAAAGRAGWALTAAVLAFLAALAAVAVQAPPIRAAIGW